MKTLLINCYTKDWEKKEKNYLALLQPFGEVKVIQDEAIQKDFDTTPYRAIIITGSGKDISKGEYYDTFLSFLRKSERPILGICYGHQVLAHAYGCRVEMGERMTNRFDENPHFIQILEEDDLFWRLGTAIQVDEDHHEYVQLDDNSPFNLLAMSEPPMKEGKVREVVEAIRHREKALYGVQFHPERSGEVGRSILQNFYERVVGVAPLAPCLPIYRRCKMEI